MEQNKNQINPTESNKPGKATKLLASGLAVAGLTGFGLKAAKTVEDGVRSTPLKDKTEQVVPDAGTPRDTETLGREITDTDTPPVTDAVPAPVVPENLVPADNTSHESSSHATEHSKLPNVKKGTKHWPQLPQQPDANGVNVGGGGGAELLTNNHDGTVRLTRGDGQSGTFSGK